MTTDWVEVGGVQIFLERITVVGFQKAMPNAEPIIDIHFERSAAGADPGEIFKAVAEGDREERPDLRLVGDDAVAFLETVRDLQRREGYPIIVEITR